MTVSLMILLANILVKNRFVNNANVTLTTYFDDGNVSLFNVRIANNDGRVHDTIILVLTLIILRLVTIYLTTTEILYKHLN